MNLKLIAPKVRPDHWARFSDMARERGLSAASFLRLTIAETIKADAREKRQAFSAK